VVVNEESRVIERMMRGCPFGSRVYHYDVVESTQIEAKRLAQAKSPEGTLVIARVQTKAYGRRQTAWDSKAGGLWFSLVLYPKFSPDYGEAFSLAIAKSIEIALSKSIEGASFETKAPNDILAVTSHGMKKKVCGILCETQISLDSRTFSNRQSPIANRQSYDWLVLGVGLNVNNIVDESLKDTAVTLEELAGSPVPRMPLLKTILQDLSSVYLQTILA